MGNKRLIAGIIIVVILMISFVITAFSYNQFNEEQLEILTKESNKVLQMNIETDEVDIEIKTKSNYAIVEKAIKKYIDNMRNIYRDLDRMNSEINPDTIFSGENILDKDLKKIDEYIDNIRQDAKKSFEQYKDMTTEENIIENINQEELKIRKDYYYSLYESVMLGDVMKKQYVDFEEKIENQKDELYTKLNTLEQIKQYLQDNEKYWTINKDGKIEFNNTNIMIGYYNLSNEIVS